MRLSILVSAFLAVVPSLATAQTSPQSGHWTQGPVGKHDLTPGAVTKGQLAIDGGLISRDVNIFMACEGSGASVSKLELRFELTPYPGFDPNTVGKTALLSIDATQATIPLDSFLEENVAHFVAPIAFVPPGRSHQLSPTTQPVFHWLSRSMAKAQNSPPRSPSLFRP